jgi:hypothetical protein
MYLRFLAFLLKDTPNSNKGNPVKLPQWNQLFIRSDKKQVKVFKFVNKFLTSILR